MRNRLMLFSVFCLVVCNSCKPKYENPYSDDIVGKWKLVEIRINGNIIDYSNDNIIYDFQANNKLVIIGLADSLQLFDDFKEGEHFYKYQRWETGDNYKPGPNLNIDGQAELAGRYFCTALINKQTMSISGDINIGVDNYRVRQTLEILK